MNVFINKLAVTLASTPFEIAMQQVHYTVYIQFCDMIMSLKQSKLEVKPIIKLLNNNISGSSLGIRDWRIAL